MAGSNISLTEGSDGGDETLTIAATAGSGGIGDHGARVYHNANQNIAHNTLTALALNSERWDTDAYHDVTTNNSRLTVPAGQAGKYIIVGHVRFDNNSSGARQIVIRLNGATNLSAPFML